MSSPRRLLPPAAVAFLLTCLSLLVGQVPASATVTTLCTGYSACAKAGMTASGYAKVSDTMFWRMYAGHNCTNYAAYRMVQSGLPNVRPWEGGGNATYWGTSMASITDQTPAVGSVAWWKAGVYPAGSAGHVAYVEKVVSEDEIIVSQDSWGGDFSWARVTRASKGWPSGFIHFNDVPLVNVAKPELVGTPKVGAVLSATPGTWDPGDVTTEYRWLAGGEPIPGATGPTLTVTEELLAKRVKVRVTASQIGYPTAKVASAPTPEILPGVISSTTPPSVAGEARVDETLTVTSGSWSPAPETVTYRWFAGDNAVSGGDQPTLTVTPAMVGKPLAVEVTARRSGYEDVTVRTPLGEVAPGSLTLTREAELSGTPRPGETLALTVPTTAQESDLEVEWLRGGEVVADAHGTTYPVTAADLGETLTARVRLTRPGYTTVVRELGTDRVKSPARLRLDLDKHDHRLDITTTVRARGANPVAGLVKIRAHGEVLSAKVLREGATRTRVKGLPRGTFTFKVIFPATPTVERAVLVKQVTIR